MPNRATVTISFDNMGSAAEVFAHERTTQQKDDVSLSRGYPKILDLLDQLGVKTSFFIEGWNALHNADLVQEIQRRGHDIGLHGWSHEPYHTLDAHDAERVIYDSLAAFDNIGVKPVGFRAPGGVRGPHCERVLKEFGVKFDSSVDETASARKPALLESGIPNVPWQWEMIDYYQYYMHPSGGQTPQQVADLYLGELSRAADERGYTAYIFHSFVTGVDDRRFEVLETLLERAVADERVELRKVKDIAAGVAA